jgi:hypothetical protein
LDNKFLHLIELGLKAGFMENGEKFDPFLGVPQSAIVSPLLFNIYV